MKQDLLSCDFGALKPEEKKQLIYKIAEHLDRTMEGCSFRQKLLSQLLFVQRTCHLYQYIEKNLPAPMPVLIPEMMDYTWKFFLNEVSPEELAWFEKASLSIVLAVDVGEDYGEEEFPEFWNQYHAGWDSSLACNIYPEIMNAVSYLLDQAVSKKISWYELTDGELMGVLAEYISDGELESVYKKESGGYKYAEIERHLTEIYDSPTFGRIFARLQEDLRVAVSMKDDEWTKEKLESLRRTYEKKGIFDWEEEEKIVAFLRKWARLDR